MEDAVDTMQLRFDGGSAALPELHRAMLDALPDQVVVVDGQGTVLTANRAWSESMLWSADARPAAARATGANYLDICLGFLDESDGDSKVTLDSLRDVMQGRSSRYEQQFRCGAEAAERWFKLVALPLNAGATGAIISHSDISAEVQTRQALRAERDRFKRMATVAPGVIHAYGMRPDGSLSFTYANPAIQGIYGFTPEQLHEDADLIWDVLYVGDRERVAREVKDAMGTVAVWHSEYRVNHPTKGLIWIEGHSTPVREPDGCVVWHGFLTDITARKRAEEDLRGSEEHLRLAMGTAPMGTWELDLESHELRWSENLWTMMGLEPFSVELSLETYRESLHPDDRERVVKELTQAIRTQSSLRCEFRIMRPDGTMRWSLSHGRVVTDSPLAGRRRFVGVDLDITARKQLEDQLHQAQKMEAIGRLAGGVAHDFNNLLTVINGYCHVLFASLASDDDARRQHVTAIQDAGERATRLTKQLLAFSRKAMASPQLVDLNALLLNFEELLGRLVGEDILLALDLLPDRLFIHADPAQLEQVIVNLAINARDAMSTGGRLIIRTDIVTIASSPTAMTSLLKPGRYAEITVTDTGCGMSSDVLAKVFEPFFTTKPVGKGTGLGLPVVHGIVTQSGGEVTVQTQVGVGTTFRIHLPLTEAEQCSEPEPSPPRSLRGNETILLVEDQPDVRKLASAALRSQGYHVLSASSAQEGKRLFSQHAQQVHLLLSDLVMTGMGGGQLATELRRQSPRLKVIFISGNSEEACVQQGVLTSSDAFLAKPFKESTLVRKVRGILDAPP